jgi:myo-inositol 2-dehydrogenase / D-chiro-inositol 1-dehydrogenase
MKPIRYALVGCGSMGREHIENLRALGDSEIVAVADTSEASRNAAMSRLPPQARAFDNHQAMFAQCGFDALVISTPNHTHAAVLADALATDAHILVEKPLVTRVDEGLALLKQSEGRKGIVWVALEYRYMPPVAELVRMAHDGAVGTIHQVAIREHREPFYEKVDDWNRFSANTGGTLVEKCCHYFNLMEVILREPAVRVYASGGQRVNHLDECYGGRRPDILDSAYAIVEHASGARAMLDLCMFAEGSIDKEQIVVVGDEGKLESLLPSCMLHYGRRADWGRKKGWGDASGTGRGVDVRRVWDRGIRYQGAHFGASYIEHQKFANAIRSGSPSEIPLAEGLRSVAVGLAAHRSIETGLPVAVAEVLPALT